MSDKTKRQVVGMSIGILIHNMILLLICLIFFRTVPVIAGVLIRSRGGGGTAHQYREIHGTLCGIG